MSCRKINVIGSENAEVRDFESETVEINETSRNQSFVNSVQKNSSDPCNVLVERNRRRAFDKGQKRAFHLKRQKFIFRIENEDVFGGVFNRFDLVLP